MKRLVPTAEMTLGPFFPREFAQDANDLTRLEGKPVGGEPVEIAGRVLQGNGAPVANLVLEIWQADDQGRYDNPAFCGWGRAATDGAGMYAFRTIRPGATPGRIAHINFCIVYSGLMRQLQTVMFFERAADPVLDAVAPASLRERLIAKKTGANSYRFDIRLRGGDETPFFDD
jgi:protocatechuate 3,4-dioxygenase, alpha subunit